MTRRVTEVIGIATLALSFSACGETGNYNANANANTAANENRAVANNNANVNASPKRDLTREDYERDKDKYAQEAREMGRKIGTGLHDGWLWAKTRFDLAAADDLRDSTINVDVENDVVILTGTVSTTEQRARAESVVKAVDGVRSVRNQLKVSAADDTNRNKNTD